MPRKIRTEAVVLKRDNMGESDRVATLLTPGHGKLRAKAQGARKSRKRFVGCLEPFVRIDAVISERGRGGLSRIEEALVLDPHESIKTDLVAIGHAGYLCELCAVLLAEEDEAAGFYHLLTDSLCALDRGPLTAARLRMLELQALSLAGLAPSLDACLVCATRSFGVWRFDHCEGGVVCGDCAKNLDPRYLEELTAAGLEVLRRLQSGRLPEEPISSAAMSLLRNLLAHVIDQHVCRPLKSREFLRQLARKT